MAVETITWVAPDGTTFPFYGSSGYTVTDGSQGGPDGRYAPTYSLVTEQLPNDGGTRLRNVVPQPRTITVPLEVADPQGDAPATRALLRALINACDPRKGDGFLRFATPDGTTREFVCRYSQGLEGDDSIQKASPGMASFLVVPQWVAFDPMCRDAADNTTQWALDNSGGDFFPIFPLVLTASSVFAETTIPVFGDDDCWPVWTVKGPGARLVVTNMTMGRSFSWGGTLDVGESLTIDTRPGSQSGDPKSVRDNLGIKRFTELTAWDLWPFTPGNQRVHIEFDNATANSLVVATWRSRWETT